MAAGLLTAQTLGADADSMKDWLRDPQKLLQLIAAAEGSRGESGDAPGGGPGGEGTGTGGSGSTGGERSGLDWVREMQQAPAAAQALEQQAGALGPGQGAPHPAAAREVALEPAQGLALAVEHPAAKALIRRKTGRRSYPGEERGQAHPGAEGHAEAVPAVWAQAALGARARRAEPADRAIREAAFRPGPRKTKTSWEF